MRLFVAIYPPPAVVDDLVGQLGRLRTGAAAAAGINVRLADPANLHVTLAFLGEVDEEQLTGVETALDRATRTWHRRPGITGSRSDQETPQLRLGGGGRFGRGAFTVLWVGLVGDVDAIRTLGAAIRRELRRGRLPHDRRPFRPHLTLARPGDRLDRAAVEADRQTLDGYLGPSWPVTEMVLVRSHLGPRPSYDWLASWSL